MPSGGNEKCPIKTKNKKLERLPQAGEGPGAPGKTTNCRYPFIVFGALDIFNFYWTFSISIGFS
jgi:hypothetical protein